MSVTIPATRENVVSILNDMGCGKSTIKQSCAKRGIDKSSVWEMIHSDESLMAIYNEKRMFQIAIVADEILDLAEAGTPYDDTGKASAVMVNVRKLQIETKKWVLSKLLASTYGEKLDDKQDKEVVIDV